MIPINIEGTKDTPAIVFSTEEGILSISGYSYPENPVEFYKPILDLVDEMSTNLATDKAFKINIQLTYFNSSSSKIFMDIFDRLEEMAKDHMKIEVNWFYDADNESIQEYGEDFKEGLDSLKFNIVEIES